METVQLEAARPEISLLTLNRPDRLNALNEDMIRDLLVAFDEVSADRTCRVVVMTGAGRGFCSGLDLKESSVSLREDGSVSAAGLMAFQKSVAALILRLRAVPQPVIAAVNGPASGAGLALALASDIRICSSSARFNAAFVRVGISGCDLGVSYLLPRLIGASRAFELMLTGRLIDAAEAESIGLVLKSVPEGGVVEAGIEIAELIRGNSPFGVWMTKEVMWSNLEGTSLQAAIDLENRTQVLSALTQDHREAVQAFVEKRPPRFTNT